VGCYEVQDGLNAMKQRFVLGLLGALLMLLLEGCVLGFMLTDKTLMHVFFALFMLGTDFLVFARDRLGWSIHSEGLGELPLAWSRWLIILNLLCYTALGFFIGWKLERFLQPTPKPR
jgi:hypothetical protein